MLDETTYYFTAFAIDQNNNIIDSQTLSITTEFGWHVTPNTLAYFPFETNGTDQIGNFTLSNTGSQQTLGRKFTSQSLLSPTPTGINTALCWVRFNSIGSANYVQLMRVIVWNLCFYVQGNPNNPCFWLYIQPNNYEGGSHLVTTGQRYLIGITRSKSGNTTTLKGYVNGTEYPIFSGTTPSDNPDNSGLIFTNQSVNMDISKFIMEKRTRSQAEMQSFFNKFKSKYGY